MSETRDSFVRLLGKSGAFLLFGLAFELGISFVAKLVIARILGPFNYGSVALGITLLSFSSTIVVLGLHQGVGRYLPRYDDAAERRGVILSALQIVFPLALLVGGGVGLFAPTIARVAFDEPSLTPILRVFGTAIPLAALLNFAVGCAQGQKTSVPKVLLQQIALPLTRFVGIGVALYACLVLFEFCSETIGVTYAYLASYVVASGFAAYYLLRHTPLADFGTSGASKHRELLSFSLPLVVTGAMIHIFSDLDTLMLGFFQEPGAVGIYQVIYPLGELLTMSLVAFRFVFKPIAAELDAEGNVDDMRRIYKTVTKWVTMISLPVFLVFVLFPKLVINLTFGAQYNDGALALAVLALGFFVHTLAGLNSGALTAIGRTRLIMYDNIAVAVSNIVLNLLLIPPFAFLGAAVATALSYLLLNFFYSTQLYLETGIQPFSRALLKPGVIAVGLITIIYYVSRALFVIDAAMLVVLGVLFAVSYGVIILRFGGIEEEEVMLVMSFEERFDVDLGPLKAVAHRFLPE